MTSLDTVSYRELFSHHDYARLWVGQVVSFTGDTLTRIALPIHVFELTGNPAALGGMFALQLIPWIVFGPFVGVLIDRFNRKNLLVGAILVESTAVGLLLLSQTIWHLYFLGLVAATSQVVSTNTRQAVMPDIVGSRLYSRAVAVGIISIQAVDTIGATLAGALIALTSPRIAISVDLLTFFINAGLIVSVSFPLSKRLSPGSRSFLRDLQTGFQFIRSHLVLRFVLSFMVLRGLTMIGILPLFVVFIESELRAGPFEFGLFTAAASLGYVLASYLAVKVERKVSPFVLLVWGSALSGLFLIPFPFVHSFYLLLLLRFLSALTYGSGNLVANIQIAQSSPSDVRGRVNSTSWSLIKSAQVISSLGLGFAATEFSASRIVASSGLLLFTGSVLAVLLAGQTVKRSLTTAI